MTTREKWLYVTNTYRPTLIAGGSAALVAVVGGFIGFVFGFGIIANLFSLIFFAISYTVFAEYMNNPTDIIDRADRRRRLFGDGIMLLAIGAGALVLLYAPTVTELALNIPNRTSVLVFGVPTFSTGLFATLAALAVRT